MSEEAPDDVQVATLCLSPGGKIKSVISLNDLESSRDPCKRVLHVAYIELWGLAVLTCLTTLSLRLHALAQFVDDCT